MKASGAFVGMTVVGDADGAAVEGDAVGKLVVGLTVGVSEGLALMARKLVSHGGSVCVIVGLVGVGGVDGVGA
jgi:hypothetical protein